jgi:hypothetical protein
MIFTWKGTPNQAVYPSNSRPANNRDYDNLVDGPYPIGKQTMQPVTVTKLGLVKPEGSNSYYDPVTKSVYFGQVTCTVVSCSLPTVCRKALPRPLKIWRKQLNPRLPNSSKRVTLSQLDAPNTAVVSSVCPTNGKVVFNEVYKLKTCNGTKVSPGECRGGTNAIRRTANTRIAKNYCTSHAQYLQRRCKTFEQNQTLGKRIAENTFTSAQFSSLSSSDVSGDCSKVYFKPSNSAFQQQGGVSSATRTNAIKYNTIVQSTRNHRRANYSTAQATLDFGYRNIPEINKAKVECPAFFRGVRRIRCPKGQA